MLFTFLINSFFLISQALTNEQQFDILKTKLEQYKFHVVIEMQPKRGPYYGQVTQKTGEVWLNPVIFDLQIATPVIIHEAVHAAQFCKGKGKFAQLDLTINPIVYAQRFFNFYIDNNRKELEREAYAVQTQPNSFDMVTSLLKQYCNK